MIEIDIIKPLYTADGIINLKVNKKINKGDFLTLFVLTIQSASHFFRLFIAINRYTIILIKHSEEMK